MKFTRISLMTSIEKKYKFLDTRTINIYIYNCRSVGGMLTRK